MVSDYISMFRKKEGGRDGIYCHANKYTIHGMSKRDSITVQRLTKRLVRGCEYFVLALA